ncbi:nuclear pore complex protein Nup205-like [Macrosteles quadrilineatus]|uniref:nuclear pore complex protein Nup205-like n=1 Tax=Macrosteles quadrilineatus TaxID=74068 RepID=UPI0023E2ADF1|nr:nuclear pore complex protein Nup205-like [Macrosteles quadrilineatus]
MEATQNEDLWTLFKSLQHLVERAVCSEDDSILDPLQKALQKHKQNFLTLLKNPPKDAKAREELSRATTEGIRLGGLAQQLLPQELVDEIIIISDMYNLNEYMVLYLLTTAQSQMVYHPGLTRGLVAVLLYYDGRKALVSALRMLMQARHGALWTVDAAPEVTHFITAYTRDLLDNDLIVKVLGVLSSLDLSKEMELLQNNRALGGPRHHHTVVNLFQETRQLLADIVYLVAAQSGLPKEPTDCLLEHLRGWKPQTDASGGVDGVTLSLQMALLYVLDVGVLQRREDGEELLEKMPLISDPRFMPALLRELSPRDSERPWQCEGLKALTQLTLAVTLTSLRVAPPNIQPQGVYEEDEILIDSAIKMKVFQFLNNSFLLNETIYKEEFYLRRLHNLLTDFIIQMPLKLKELRNKAEDAAKTYNAYVQEGLDPPTNLSQSYEQLLLSLSRLYGTDPLNLQLELDYWCTDGAPQNYAYRMPPRQVSLYKFVRQSGESLPPTLFVPYMKMLASLASCPAAAKQAYQLLKTNQPPQSNVAWDHFFSSLNRYYTSLKQELPPMSDTVYRHRNYPKVITPLEIHGLQAVLLVIRTVAEQDEISRQALVDTSAWTPLLGLVTCSVHIGLKAELLLTLAALGRSPATAAVLWHNLEASQILATIPSTSSYLPRGLQTELEEVESRNEEFPLTRAMLVLLDVLTDVPIPRLLGCGTRTPGFHPYLTFVLHSVFLRFHTRSYKSVQEKWEVCRLCLHLLVKLISQYEPAPEDFVATKVQLQGGGTTSVSPPPGFHLMSELCSKSQLFRLVMQLIEEAAQMLDTYTVFVGKTTLEAAALLCLQLLDCGLRLQQRYLLALSQASSSLLLTPLNKLLLGINSTTGKPDHLLNIAKYVTYNSWLPSHALYTVRIFLAVTMYPVPQSQIVSVLTATQALTTHVRHGFVECLEADDEDPSDDQDNLSEATKTKEAILKLLLQCLNHTPPNLAHYLLGFDLDKDISHTNFQQPGMLGFPLTCLHAVMSLLNTGLRAHSDVTAPSVNPRLTELCYHLIYALAANVRTSEPTLRFLRSSGDFIQRHLAALPFNSSNKGCDLTQTAWLLKTVAIELKVTAAHQQMSQLTNLVNVLVVDKEVLRADRHLGNVTSGVQLTHSFKNDLVDLSAPYKRLILQLLGVLSFNIEPVPTPTWEFFEHSQMESLMAKCEVASPGGLKVINIKRLHRLLVNELSVVQGSSTVAQRQLILREIQNVLAHAVRQNQQHHLASATVQYLDAWRQVTEVLFSVAPTESLPFPLRFSLLLQTIFELLTKVLNATVMTELAILSSNAVLLLLVNVRHCLTQQLGKLQLSGAEDAGAKLRAFLQAKENILRDISSCLLKWILSSVSSQKLRANLYAALLSFLQLSRQQCEPMPARPVEISGGNYVSLLDQQTLSVSKHACVQVLLGFGERLLTTLCQDFSGGHDICKMLALSCLDLMIEMDPNGHWVSFLSSRGYLKFLIDSLLASDHDLVELVTNNSDTLRPLYVYESKMALLCRVASTHSGAELLLEQNCLSCLSSLQVLDRHPDITPRFAQTRSAKSMELDFIPSPATRYLQIFSPALTLCQTILSSLGVHNQSAVAQVIHFLMSHSDTVNQVLRCGSPFLQPNFLHELQQLTAVIARATNQEVVRQMTDESVQKGHLLEGNLYFGKTQNLMLGLLSRFVLSEATLKDLTSSVDPDRNNPQARAEVVLTFLQIAGNLAMYARNLVSSSGLDKPPTSAILKPSLLEPNVLDKKEVSQSSLGVVVQQMVQCVSHFHREKVSLDLLVRKYQSIPDLNSTTVKEFLPEGYNRLSSLDESKQVVNQLMLKEVQDKKSELEMCEFVIENSLYLLWAHLDVYMLQSIPTKTLMGIKAQKPMNPRENSWGVSMEDLNKLKQGLVSVFNDTFCKNLITVSQELSTGDRGYVEALVRRIKKLIQFVPSK